MLSITFFPILILQKLEPVFPFLMLSARQGNYWYHFFNVFGMTGSLKRKTKHKETNHIENRKSKQQLYASYF